MKSLRLTDDLSYRIAWARRVADLGDTEALVVAKVELAEAVMEATARAAKLADVKPQPVKVGVGEKSRQQLA